MNTESNNDVKLVWVTPEAEKMVTYCARVSSPQNQENLETAPKLLAYCIKNRHWSIFEMANMCVQVNTTRSISAQLIRHRSFNFQEFCLSGDSLITVCTPGSKSRSIPIKYLCENWEKPTFKLRYARSYDKKLNRFIEAPIASIYHSGIKPVYEFTIKTVQSKRKIKCTLEHKVYTKEKGFVDFKIAFDEGLTVALNGQSAEPVLYWDKKFLEDNAWMGSTKLAKELGIAEITARKWFRKNEVTPENPNNWPRSRIDNSFKAKLHSFMKWSRKNISDSKCNKCGHDGSTSRLELSHIIAHDGNGVLAFDENNLQTLCAKCHRKHDIEEQGKRYGWTLAMRPKWGVISDCVYVGEEATYDIEMNHESHNFVANGIVVHNSQRYSDVASLGPLKMPHLRRQDNKNRQNSIDDLSMELVQNYYRRISTLFEESEHLYQEMISNGVAKECAREVLPMSSPTRLYVNGSIRSWITYIALREKHGTQMEHMKIAKGVKEIFCEEFPSIAEALGGSEPWLI